MPGAREACAPFHRLTSPARAEAGYWRRSSAESVNMRGAMRSERYWWNSETAMRTSALSTVSMCRLARAVERSDGESLTPTSDGHRQPSGDEVRRLPQAKVLPVSYIREYL